MAKHHAHKREAKQGTPAPQAPQVDANDESQSASVTPNEEAQASDTAAALAREHDEAKARVKALEEQRLRLMAEYDNFRKRSRKEKAQLRDDVIVEAVKALLPVIDSLERSATEAARVTGDGKAFADGVPKIYEQARTLLKSWSVEPIEACHVPFDPQHHHAVQQVPDDTHEAGSVIDVLQVGYRLGDRLIRPAMVVVVAPRES